MLTTQWFIFFQQLLYDGWHRVIRTFRQARIKRTICQRLVIVFCSAEASHQHLEHLWYGCMLYELSCRESNYSKFCRLSPLYHTPQVIALSHSYIFLCIPTTKERKMGFLKLKIIPTLYVNETVYYLWLQRSLCSEVLLREAI